MAQQHVDTVRRGYEMFAAGNLEGVTALFADDVEVADSGGLGISGTAAGTRHGPEGFLRSLDETLDAFEDYRVDTGEFTDAGEAVVVQARISGRGKASGAQMETEVAHLWVFGEDGKVIRGEVYETVEEALKAAGG